MSKAGPSPTRGSGVDLVVSADPTAAAGQLVVEKVRELAADQPRIAIPGGSAAAAVGAVRAQLRDCWPNVRLTWVDERCVSFDHEDSNRGLAYRNGWLSADDPVAVELPLFVQGEQPRETLSRVGSALTERFAGGLDVALLGMGPDGHVASLFPGRPEPRGPVFVVEDSPKPPAERVTLSRAFLSKARAGVLLAFGASKRAAVARVLEGDAELPALAVSRLTVVTDRATLAPE